MFENIDFVTWITTILIFDQFYHVSQDERKISPVWKNPYAFDVVLNITTSGAAIGE